MKIAIPLDQRPQIVFIEKFHDLWCCVGFKVLMATSFETVRDIYQAFGGPTAMARRFGGIQTTYSNHIDRNQIPAKYWLPIVNDAAVLGFPEITLQLLAEMHARASVAAAE